jgi:hypothetical protein
MFQRFLDVADYWFGYSDNSSAGSYDPTQECFVVVANDQANAANAAEVGAGEVSPNPGTGPHQGAGPSAPPPRRRGVPTSTHSWPKHASSRPNSRKNTAQCGYFVPPSLRKPPHAANACASWASKPASASTPTSTSTIQACPRERARSSSLPRHCCGPCPLPQRLRHGICTARRRRSSSKRPCSRPRARRPASTSRGARGATGVCKALKCQFTRVVRRGSPPTKVGRRSGSGSLTRAGMPKTATLATSSTPGRRATQRRGRRQATTRGEVDAMTAEKTAS